MGTRYTVLIESPGSALRAFHALLSGNTKLQITAPKHVDGEVATDHFRVDDIEVLLRHGHDWVDDADQPFGMATHSLTFFVPMRRDGFSTLETVTAAARAIAQQFPVKVVYNQEFLLTSARPIDREMVIATAPFVSDVLRSKGLLSLVIDAEESNMRVEKLARV